MRLNEGYLLVLKMRHSAKVSLRPPACRALFIDGAEWYASEMQIYMNDAISCDED